MSKLTWSTATNFFRPLPKEIWRSLTSMSFSLSAMGSLHFLAQVLDRVGPLYLGRPVVHAPVVGRVGLRHLEERRLLDEIDVQSHLVAGCKGVAREPVQQFRGGPVDRVHDINVDA